MTDPTGLVPPKAPPRKTAPPVPDSCEFPPGFLWGASTSAHQTEGNNTGSDLWAAENIPGSPIRERSGDACDSLHRWPEDLDLIAGLGLTAYRFSIEWARIEPEQGKPSSAMLAHYRRIIAGCLERAITPVVTLHHFTSPRWFTERGGWRSPEAPDLFGVYARTVAPILNGVPWICTINEPNMVAIFQAMLNAHLQPEPIAAGLPEPDPAVTDALIRAHQAARQELTAVLGARTGWTVANLNAQAARAAHQEAARWRERREDQFLAPAADDDFIGVQAYTRTLVGPDGQIPPGPDVRQTLTGWEYYPDAAAEAVRHTASVLPGVPILVTENGIATTDDIERIEYTSHALAGLHHAITDGIDVRGYLHWSLLDNYEWGTYRPTFGLIAVDRTTFARTVRPSARWLGEVATANALHSRAAGAGCRAL
jgi:beta-glucosidase